MEIRDRDCRSFFNLGRGVGRAGLGLREAVGWLVVGWEHALQVRAWVLGRDLRKGLRRDGESIEREQLGAAGVQPVEMMVVDMYQGGVKLSRDFA